MPHLDEYRRKRDFTKTAEPGPEPAAGVPADDPVVARNLVFVVQQHAAFRAGMHWDFRLEVDGVLKSWPLRKPPSLNPADKRLATMVEDHPYDYRTFEGVIPRGEYGGGQVIVWDEGIYTPDEDGAYSWNDKAEGSRRMLAAIEQGKVSFTLRGRKLHGSFALVKTKYGPNSWLLIKHRDADATDTPIADADVSVRSGLTVTDLREGRLPSRTAASRTTMPPGAKEALLPNPRTLRPMLATLLEKPFDSEAWLWEPKLDGVRALVFVKDGEVELRSRRGVDITRAYPGLVEALRRQPARSLVLDGEICALDAEGVPRFQLLQPRINLTRAADVARAEAEQPAVFFAFDLLYLDGHDLRAVPLRERKALLRSRILGDGTVRLVTHVEADGIALTEGARRLGFEGVVGKRADSRYDAGARSPAWVKIKTVQEQEFVVGGFTPGEGARSKSFGALAIGYYEGGRLLYAGNVGSGFSDRALADLVKRLEALRTETTPFADQERVEGRPAWVRPELVAQVKFAEWTKDGRLRAPVFEGLRNDIEPRQVRRERPEILDAIEIDGAEDVEGQADAIDAVGEDPSASHRDREPETPAAKAADLHPEPTVRSGPPDQPRPRATHTAHPEPVEGRTQNNAATLDLDVASVIAQVESAKPNATVTVQGEPVKLTNLDKVFWPAHRDAPPLTKRDLILYYSRVAPVLLPHLLDRPLTLTRYPNGIEGSLFYQKHYTQPIPSFVETVPIFSSSNEGDGRYILCNNLPTLVWLAQIADLELHAWMSRLEPAPDALDRPLDAAGSEETIDASVLNYPDYVVFDLDPYIYSGAEAKGAEPEFNQRGWDKTVEIALALKELLDQLSLSSYVKTSGKTGVHVYVPVLRHYTYDDVRAATATIGRFLIQQRPKDITMDWDTSKRAGKVFFDHNQNTRGKTLAAQYSLRPTPWAGVSTPVAWSELPHLEPTALNLRTVPARIAERGDLWRDILARKNDLSVLLRG